MKSTKPNMKNILPNTATPKAARIPLTVMLDAPTAALWEEIKQYPEYAYMPQLGILHNIFVQYLTPPLPQASKEEKPEEKPEEPESAPPGWPQVGKKPTHKPASTTFEEEIKGRMK